MPVGTKYEEIGFAFNKGVITDILRSELGFEGIICTDWGLITDVVLMGQDMPARAWGCEQLSELERIIKIIDAGCDQLGGESRPELVVEAVQSGLVAKSRIDQSVRRILMGKFVLGLFDDKRFVDVEKAATVVGGPKFMQLGGETQRRAFTVLINENGSLPIPQQLVQNSKVYIEWLQDDSAAKRGLNIVTSPDEADIALLRLQAPYEPRPGGFEAMFRAGSLEFPECEVARLSETIRKVRLTAIDVYLDRPAVLTPLVEV
jgi:beta-glucosidase